MITYKNITDVEVLEQASENTKVLVNEGGELMQAPYSNFEDKMSNAEVLEEIPENAKVLVNDNGKLKQVACREIGGSAGVATAIVKGFYYMNRLTGVASVEEVTQDEYTCENMTFEEARNIILSGEPLDVIMMGKDGWHEYYIVHPHIRVTYINESVPCIELWAEHIYNASIEDYTDMRTYWTADGFLIDDPNASA